ncbi:hypothetical protein BS17DRAFT_878988 [Gyrodon lividus]|nr:hypothetical protein BS17DRAFT_878988 [Gyrodon lividus]
MSILPADTISWQLGANKFSAQVLLSNENMNHTQAHGNVLIDNEYNVRPTDFGLTTVLGSVESQLSYLQTAIKRPGAIMWSAPELFHDGDNLQATAKSDIYSLGSIVLFKLKKGQNPERPASPVISDDVWNFIKQCWSPRLPAA